MAWSCHENGRSTHSEASAALGSCGIQEKTWQTKDGECIVAKKDLQRMGLTWEEVEATSSRQTLVASTCGPMHR